MPRCDAEVTIRSTGTDCDEVEADDHCWEDALPGSIRCADHQPDSVMTEGEVAAGAARVAAIKERIERGYRR